MNSDSLCYWPLWVITVARPRIPCARSSAYSARLRVTSRCTVTELTGLPQRGEEARAPFKQRTEREFYIDVRVEFSDGLMKYFVDVIHGDETFLTQKTHKQSRT